IGGPSLPAANTISGNGGDGVEISGATATGTIVQGNRIGLFTTGPIANGRDGVSFQLSAGKGTVVRNTLAFNRRGVYVQTGTRNRISSNSIFSNRQLGIDLSPAGANQNDPGATDSGPNKRQ